MKSTDHSPAPRPQLSPADLAALGMPNLAYIRHVVGDDGDGWAIHAADGTPIGVAPNRELAFAAVKQHDLEPVSVH